MSSIAFLSLCVVFSVLYFRETHQSITVVKHLSPAKVDAYTCASNVWSKKDEFLYVGRVEVQFPVGNSSCGAVYLLVGQVCALTSERALELTKQRYPINSTLYGQGTNGTLGCAYSYIQPEPFTALAWLFGVCGVLCFLTWFAKVEDDPREQVALIEIH